MYRSLRLIVKNYALACTVQLLCAIVSQVVRPQAFTTNTKLVQFRGGDIGGRGCLAPPHFLSRGAEHPQII